MKDANVIINGKVNNKDTIRVSTLTMAQSKIESGRTLQFNSTSTQVGDLGLFFQILKGNRLSGGWPSGWTGIADEGNDTNQFYLLSSYKKLEATDIDTDITGADATSTEVVAAYSFRPDKAITSISIVNQTATITTANQACTTIRYTLNAGGTSPVIAFIAYGSKESVFANFQEGALKSSVDMTMFPPTDNPNRFLFNKYKIYNGGQIQETIDYDLCLTNVPAVYTILNSFYIQVD